MNTNLIERAYKLFNNDMVPTHTNRHNRAAWLRSVRFLGHRWLLATPINRKTKGEQVV